LTVALVGLIGLGLAVTPVRAGADPSRVPLTVTIVQPNGVPSSIVMDRQDSRVSVARMTDTDIEVGGTDDASSTDVDLELIPPAGERFHVGHYTAAYPDAYMHNPVVGHAELSLALNSTDVFDTNGDRQLDIDIIDLAVDAAGNVTRLDVDFRRFTDRAYLNTFGEITYNELPSSGRIVTARHLEWPQSPVGAAAVSMPVRIENISATALAIGGIHTSGPAAADFSVTHDPCSAAAIPPRSSCTVWVGYTPTASGLRTAQLSLPAGTSVDIVALQGNAPDGLSRLTTSGNDHLVDNGVSHSYPDGPYQLVASGNGNRIGFSVTKAYDQLFQGPVVEIQAPVATRIGLGVHAAGDIFANGTSWGVRVTGAGTGCGSYRGVIDVESITFDATGNPSSARIEFSVACGEAPYDHLHGSLLWRVPAGSPATPVTAVLDAPEQLAVGQVLTTRTHHLVMQGDGNLVLYNAAGRPTWSTGTTRSRIGYRFVVQTDGHLVVYGGANHPVWIGGAYGAIGRHYLVLQADGNLVLRGPTGTALWSSNTAGK
jgi:hypothetical protein